MNIDRGLVSLFSVLRDKDKAMRLWESLQLTLYSKDEFNRAKVTWEDGLNILNKSAKDVGEEFIKGELGVDEYIKRLVGVCRRYDEVLIETARMFYVLCRQSYASNMRSWVSNTGKRGNSTTSHESWLSYIEKGFKGVVERLRDVNIENSSYENILSRYDSKSTLFYLDPPYIMGTRRDKTTKVYNSGMSDDMHRDLVRRLIKLEGKFILSGYDHPIYRPLNDAERYYRMKVGSKVVSSSNQGRGNKRVRANEYVWTNFRPGVLR